MQNKSDNEFTEVPFLERTKESIKDAFINTVKGIKTSVVEKSIGFVKWNKKAGLGIYHFFKNLPHYLYVIVVFIYKLIYRFFKGLGLEIYHLFKNPIVTVKKWKVNIILFKEGKKYPKVRNLFDPRKKNNLLSIFFKIVTYIVIIVIAYIFLLPLLEVIFKSFMTTKDLINPEVFYLPQEGTIRNYTVATDVLELGTALWNSIWFSAVLALLQTLVSALTAYAFARLNFKGKKFWLILLVVAFIVPTPVIMVPRITIFKTLGDMLNYNFFGTLWPNILVTSFGQGVYSTILILIFYNFFKQIPFDLDEAAYLDGANNLQVLWHVIIKLSKPVIMTVFLFSFVWNWNESLMTSRFVSDSLMLIPSQLELFDSLFVTGASGVDLNEGYKMAGTVLSLLPLIILYLLVQKEFIEGIESSGITGQ